MQQAAVAKRDTALTGKSGRIPGSTEQAARLQAPAMKVRELLRLLEQDGWYLVRTRGSHRPLRHSTRPGTVTVSGNAGADVPRGTLGAILKQARIQPLRNVNAIRGRN